MNQKVTGPTQPPNKVKDSKSQKSLKGTISQRMLNKYSSTKKIPRKDKSDKKPNQFKSKKQIQAFSNFPHHDLYNDIDGKNYDYYNSQAHEHIVRKSRRKDRQHIQHSKSKQASFEAESYIRTTADIKKIESASSLNRLKFAESKGVINFDGKYVKAPAEEIHKKYNHHLTTSNSQYTDLIHGEKDEERKKKKRGERSRNKTNQKKVKSKSKSKGHELKKKIADFKDHMEIQNLHLNKKYKLQKEKEENNQTEPSPGHGQYQRREVVEFDEVRFEINEQKQKMGKVHIQKNSLLDRMKCINMLSKICGELQFKKETFTLSIRLFDGYLHDQIVGTKIKIISISSLLLALKLEESQTAAAFQFLISTANTCNSNRQLRNSIPVQRKSDIKSTSKKKGKKEQVTSKVNEKKKDSMYNKANSLAYIFLDEFGQDMVSKTQILEFEAMIVMKLNYFLRFRTSSYWVDLITVIWDQRILTYHDPTFEKLLFRCPKHRINMSYLLQIVEIIYYDVSVYQYSEVVLVLSAIYLLVRITMQENPDGYEHYRKVLQKSSNALFVDNVGCNKLFGQFLQSLSMEMGEILQCCQFVSGYLLPNILKKHRLHGWADWEQNYDNVLSIHSYNPELFRYSIK